MDICLNCGTEAAAALDGSCPSCGGPSVPIRRGVSGDNFSGRILGEKYILLRPLGRGGMGSVYHAVHRTLGKTVAVKVMNMAFKDHPEALKRFYSEARHASRLEHPHNVKVFDFGHEEDGLVYIVMEEVRGRSLDGVRLPMDADRALAITAQVCSALQEAHDHGLVHRDLKPANIMVRTVDGADYVTVLDYGIAKLTDSSTGITKSGMIMGTPQYLSPEQASGLKIDHRADIYALGAMLFEMITGQLPFEADTVLGLAYAHATEEPPRPSDITPINPTVEALILKCLQKHPLKRPQSMDDLRLLIDSILQGHADMAFDPTETDARYSDVALASTGDVPGFELVDDIDDTDIDRVTPFADLAQLKTEDDTPLATLARRGSSKRVVVVLAVVAFALAAALITLKSTRNQSVSESAVSNAAPQPEVSPEGSAEHAEDGQPDVEPPIAHALDGTGTDAPIEVSGQESVNANNDAAEGTGVGDELVAAEPAERETTPEERPSDLPATDEPERERNEHLSNRDRPRRDEEQSRSADETRDETSESEATINGRSTSESSAIEEVTEEDEEEARRRRLRELTEGLTSP